MNKTEALKEIHLDKINSLLSQYGHVKFSFDVHKKIKISKEITPVLCEAMLDMQNITRKKGEYVEASFMGIDGEIFDSMISKHIILTNCIYKYDEIMKII